MRTKKNSLLQPVVIYCWPVRDVFSIMKEAVVILKGEKCGNWDMKWRQEKQSWKSQKKVFQGAKTWWAPGQNAKTVWGMVWDLEQGLGEAKVKIRSSARGRKYLKKKKLWVSSVENMIRTCESPLEVDQI